MPELSRPDGTRIHYEVQGDEGPAIVLASYWSWSPGVWGEMLSDLAVDHRIVTYHLRGTGKSSRNGPYEMETDTDDLEAVVDTVDVPVVLAATADSANRSARLAARRPELVEAVVSFATAPIARAAFEGKEAMLSSEAVLQGFLEMLQHNYRGGMRTLIEATNPQMSEQELRERVDAQVEFCPPDAAVPRVREWADDDPREESRAIGNRLWIFAASSAAGPWLPPAKELASLTEEMLPQANVVELDPGPTSQPHFAAEAMRRVTAPLRGVTRDRK